MLDIAIYIMEKILNFFRCVEVRISCKKVKYVWSSNFPKAFTTNMQIGNDFFVLNTRLGVKKIQIHINFIEINVNVCLLCALHVMTSIILHTRRPNWQPKVCYVLGCYVSADFHFSHFEKLNSTFFTSLHFAQRVMY
jgi:hypothetical protein